MVSPEKVATVKALVASGLSHRNISLRVGVSRGTVKAIVTGHWETHHERMRERHIEPIGNWPWATAEQHTRCPECGKLVLMPCLMCGLEAGLVK